MIVFPKEKPVLANLNSFYLHIDKLVEHFQGEVGSGAVFFRSAPAQAVIFFDQDNLVNVCFQNKKDFLQGEKAYKTLLQAVYNFIVDIYYFELEKVYFWAQIPSARLIYKDLSTDSTDFKGLLKKIAKEKFTGFFELSLKRKLGEGLIFFNDGEVVGGSCVLRQSKEDEACQPQQFLEMAGEAGAKFNIFSLSLQKNTMVKSGKNKLSVKQVHDEIDVIKGLSEMLRTFEGIVKKEKSYDFLVLIRQKFIDKSVKYYFLDPFVSEFSYENGQIFFTGSVDDYTLAEAVVEVVLELADDLEKREHLLQRLHLWRKKYGRGFSEMGIKL